MTVVDKKVQKSSCWSLVYIRRWYSTRERLNHDDFPNVQLLVVKVNTYPLYVDYINYLMWQKLPP